MPLNAISVKLLPSHNWGSMMWYGKGSYGWPKQRWTLNNKDTIVMKIPEERELVKDHISDRLWWEQCFAKNLTHDDDEHVTILYSDVVCIVLTILFLWMHKCTAALKNFNFCLQFLSNLLCKLLSLIYVYLCQNLSKW